MNKSLSNPPSRGFLALCEAMVSHRAVWLDSGLLVPNQGSLSRSLTYLHAG
jgi:hypothetical protein